MKVKTLAITDLFGNPGKITITFNNTNPNITILHGPNGIGKTTILSLLNAVLNGNLDYLYETYFSSIRITFSDGFILNVKKLKATNLSSFSDEIPYIVYKDNKDNEIKVRKVNKTIQTNFTNDKEVSGGSWNIPNKKEFIDYFYNRLAGNTNQKQFDEYISKLKESISVKMINTNRLALNNLESIYELLKSDSNNIDKKMEEGNLKDFPKETVLAFSKHLSDEIKSIKTRKEIESEKLDSSFPARLLKLAKKTQKKITFQELDKDLTELLSISDELRNSGLSDKEFDVSIFNDSIPDEMFPVIKLYIQDNLKKLSFYDELLTKVKAFIEIINERNGFINKKMSITQDGINFTSTITNETIPIDRLSSGESHLLILYYYLIFLCSDNNSVILIDEPEISMHISWQEEFINCLEDICNLRNLQAIVTTHSPNIVNGHMSLLKGLAE